MDQIYKHCKGERDLGLAMSVNLESRSGLLERCSPSLWDSDFHTYSFLQYYPEGTIVTTGFSKWASVGGWRAGYALFPKELHSLKEAVASAGSHSYTCLPTPIQYALLKGCNSEVWDTEIIGAF